MMYPPDTYISKNINAPTYRSISRDRVGYFYGHKRFWNKNIHKW